MSLYHSTSHVGSVCHHVVETFASKQNAVYHIAMPVIWAGGLWLYHTALVWKHALVTYQDVTVQGPEEHPKEGPLLPPRPWDHTLAHLLQQCPFGTIDCIMLLPNYGVSTARHQQTITQKL